MQRGRALLAGVAAAVVAGFVPASADTTAPSDPCTSASTLSSCELPRPACTHAMTDSPGDGDAKYVGNGSWGSLQPQVDAVKSTAFPNNTSLDLLGVYLRVTPDFVQTFFPVNHIVDPSAMGTDEATYRYTVTFKVGTKTVVMSGEQYNLSPTAVYEPGDSPTNGLFPQVHVDGRQAYTGGTSQLIVRNASPNPSWVIISTQRSKLETALGAPLTADTLFTGISADTKDVFYNEETPADSTTQTGAAAQHNALDDWCFGPPPTALNSLTVASPVVYHHSTPVSAVLVDQDGKPLAGKPVTFTIHDGKGIAVTGTTDADGRAQVLYGPVGAAAGTYAMTATFPGEGTTLKTSTATSTITVTAQKTAFAPLKIAKPSAKTRVVTATLLDDMSRGVAGARVDWYLNGKKAASTTTDKSGHAVFKAGKPGQTVQARFAGKAGMLLASVSKSAKL
jgi:hypothetical protein